MIRLFEMPSRFLLFKFCSNLKEGNGKQFHQWYLIVVKSRNSNGPSFRPLHWFILTFVFSSPAKNHYWFRLYKIFFVLIKIGKSQLRSKSKLGCRLRICNVLKIHFFVYWDKHNFFLISWKTIDIFKKWK